MEVRAQTKPTQQDLLRKLDEVIRAFEHATESAVTLVVAMHTPQGRQWNVLQEQQQRIVAPGNLFPHQKGN